MTTNAQIASHYYDSDNGIGDTVQGTADKLGVSEEQVHAALADTYRDQGDSDSDSAGNGDLSDQRKVA